MKLRHLLAGCTLLALIAAPAAQAQQSRPEFVALGRVSAALYKPAAAGPQSHIAFLIAHRTGNNLNNNACHELVRRGFVVVCFNTRFINNETAVRWEETPLDVKAAVDFARTVPGVTKVILLGHSGGSSLMGFYQAVAEKGVAYCQGPSKLSPCGNDLANLPPADGLVLPDAHPGNGVQALRGINPSLSIVDGKVRVDPALDPFDPKNGYNPEGPSRYSKEFRDRYYAAQSKQMNDRIADVQQRIARMKQGNAVFPDDDIVLVPFSDQAGAARLDLMDPTIPEIMHTAQPRKLLKNDGSITTAIVRSVAFAEPEQAKNNRTFSDGVKILTFRSFLSTNAIRSTNSNDRIDHCSTNNSTTCAVASISVPTLVAAMGGYHLVRDQETIYERSIARDKDFIVVEGAEHNYNACKECEKTPGQYANSLKNLFDYIARWTTTRF
jgi:hypothetical protein